MSYRTDPELLTFLTVLAISVISGFISIAQRVVRGQPATVLWVISEFMSALLCGYLAYDLYGEIGNVMPSWITMPIFVAFAAHLGGRAFQEFENYLYRKYPNTFQRTRGPGGPPD